MSHPPDPAPWDAARRDLAGDTGSLNVAAATVGRQVAVGRGDRVAVRLRADAPDTAAPIDMTFAQLDHDSGRFAGALSGLGVGPGQTVFALLGRGSHVMTALLGTVRHGSVFCPLFAAFGPEPIRQRFQLGDGVVLITSTELYDRRIVDLVGFLPSLRHVILTDGQRRGTLQWDALMTDAPDEAPRATRADDPALLHFTSGTTGRPKGALHAHEAVVAHYATARSVLGLSPDDVFWCTADPGWVTGTSYGVIAPLAVGATSVVDTQEYDADRWYSLIEQERVTVWYTSPTALRLLMRAGDARARAHDLSSLRLVFSVGEPLNAEVVRWGERVLGVAIRDTWWQTETGAIMIAVRADDDVVAGSMGRPVPGIEATLLAPDPDDPEGGLLLDDAGHSVEVTDPGIQGEIALRTPWPSMMRDYLGAPERYESAFRDGWYLSGDLARRDAAGLWWFVGRGDDVIKSAGHLIGPFEVESALMEHPAVAEAGVIGVPDPVAGESVKAFVSLSSGCVPSADLARELVGFSRSRLGAAVAPRTVEFRQDLPRTRSGKIMRRLLRAQELGLPTGDLSTLEGGA